MAQPQTNTKTVKLTGGHSGQGGIITGVGTSAKAGDVVKLDRWTANMLINAGLAKEQGGK